jgi:hypothetical protein
MKTLVTLVIAISTMACATDPLPAGAVCQATADCKSGLSCLDLAQFNGTMCMVVGKTCSTTCATDPDCAPLGANFRCFAGCGADKVCGQIAGP